MESCKQELSYERQLLNNKKTLTAEAVKNGLPIPQITFFWM